MGVTKNQLRVLTFLKRMATTMGCFCIHPTLEDMFASRLRGETSVIVEIIEDIWNPIDGVDFRKGETFQINPQNLDSHLEEEPLSRLYSFVSMGCWSYVITERFVEGLQQSLFPLRVRPYDVDPGLSRWSHP